MATIQVSARIDEQVKKEALQVLESQGLDIATAIKILFTKTANEKVFPISLQTSKNNLPEDWFSKERLENRMELNNLIFDKPVKRLDLSKREDVEEFFSE